MPSRFPGARNISTVYSVENRRILRASPRAGYGPSPTAALPLTARLSKARMQVLDVLAAQPEACTVAAIATALGQHTNTVREHLDALVDARLAQRRRAPAHGRGRPAWLYATTVHQNTLSDGAIEYASLASVLADTIARTSPDPEGDAIAAGRRWGAELVRTRGHRSADDAPPAAGAPDTPHAQDTQSTARPPTSGPGTSGQSDPTDARRAVVRLLDDLGFAPSTDDAAVDVALRRCPLLEAAYRHPDVVCGVHLGLARGALEALGAPSDDTALVPFAEKGACRLLLVGADPFVTAERALAVDPPHEDDTPA